MCKMPKPVKIPHNKSKTLSTPVSKFQYLFLLACLSLLNVSFFFGFGNYNSHVQCSSDIVVEVISLYIAHNGETNLRDLIPSECSASTEKTEKQLKTSIDLLLDTCSRAEKEITNRPKRTKPFVTLITTFADHLHTDGEKISVHNNTIQNWARFKPFVNLVLFSNDSFWTGIAMAAGWDVLKPADEIDGKRPPILKSMLHSAKELHDTPWYGYLNADIILTHDLIENLEAVSKNYNISQDSVMLTGRRTNVDNFTNLDATSDISIRHHAKKYGILYKEDAEDFFITTKPFPWEEIIPLVVGRPGYDNWLVGEARCHLNTTVIDVTETFLALHQTTVKGGNMEGHLHPESDYNINMLKKHNIVPNFLAGLTDCIIFNSYHTFCESIAVKRRTKFGKDCKCKPSHPIPR